MVSPSEKRAILRKLRKEKKWLAEEKRKTKGGAKPGKVRSVKNEGYTPSLPMINPPEYKKGMKSDFYKTKEWRTARFMTLNANGRVCVSCGSFGKGVVFHVDHIIPRSVDQTKELDLTNLQVLCEDCNIGKGKTIWKPE